MKIHLLKYARFFNKQTLFSFYYISINLFLIFCCLVEPVPYKLLPSNCKLWSDQIYTTGLLNILEVLWMIKDLCYISIIFLKTCFSTKLLFLSILFLNLFFQQKNLCCLYHTFILKKCLKENKLQLNITRNWKNWDLKKLKCLILRIWPRQVLRLTNCKRSKWPNFTHCLDKTKKVNWSAKWKLIKLSPIVTNYLKTILTQFLRLPPKYSSCPLNNP